MAPTIFLGAAVSSQELRLAEAAIPAVLTALAVGALCWVVLDLVSRPAAERGREGGFEAPRRAALRAKSAVYRLTEPLIDELVALRSHRDAKLLERIRRDLLTSAWPAPWTPAEFLASKRVEAGLVGLGGIMLGLLGFGDPRIAAVAGVAAAWLYYSASIKDLSERATRRTRAIKKRLPFAIDLMALMMEAGASFQESMAVVVHDDRGSPLADEFGTVLQEIEMGKTRREALESLKARLPDDDISEIVGAVVKGEELGTPLSEILRVQAQQILMKRSQRIEAASAEAQVKIVFPGIIIMLACMLVVVAPFVLAFLVSSGASAR
jgi:tight adherence protein C